MTPGAPPPLPAFRTDLRRAPGSSARRPGWRGIVFGVGSLLAHVLLVAALLAPWSALRRSAPPVPPPPAAGTVEVVMVQEAPAPPPTPPQPQTPPASQPDPTPSPPPSVPDTPPVPPDPAPAADIPPPAPASPPAPEPTPPAEPAAARPAPAAVNLGGDPSDAWVVHSDTLKPPAPDARFRNLPPRYPAEAARRNEHGTVVVVIHVAADGTAAGADIAESSGFPVLDGEARRAVLLWHFDPAIRDGAPVPFDYPISISFTR